MNIRSNNGGTDAQRGRAGASQTVEGGRKRKKRQKRSSTSSHEPVDEEEEGEDEANEVAHVL